MIIYKPSMFDEQIEQENSIWPWLATESMSDSSFYDEQRAADYLDAMADIASELEEAMRESSQDEWDGVEEISSAERNACDHYNERYVING